MDRAFEEGIRIKSFPFLVRATEAEFAEPVPFQAAFSVGKNDSGEPWIATESSD